MRRRKILSFLLVLFVLMSTLPTAQVGATETTSPVNGGSSAVPEVSTSSAIFVDTINSNGEVVNPSQMTTGQAFYVRVRTAPGISGIMGSEVWLNFDPSKLMPIDASAETGMQAVDASIQPEGPGVDAHYIINGVYGQINIGNSKIDAANPANNIYGLVMKNESSTSGAIKYMASNIAPQCFEQGAVLLVAGFTVLDTSGTSVAVSKADMGSATGIIAVDGSLPSIAVGQGSQHTAVRFDSGTNFVNFGNGEYNVKVNRQDLPVEMQGFTKMSVFTTNDERQSNIDSCIRGAEVYPHFGVGDYNEVSGYNFHSDHPYAIVILLDGSYKAMGYYVKDLRQVPQNNPGLSISGMSPHFVSAAPVDNRYEFTFNGTGFDSTQTYTFDVFTYDNEKVSNIEKDPVIINNENSLAVSFTSSAPLRDKGYTIRIYDQNNNFIPCFNNFNPNFEIEFGIGNVSIAPHFEEQFDAGVLSPASINAAVEINGIDLDNKQVYAEIRNFEMKNAPVAATDTVTATGNGTYEFNFTASAGKYSLFIEINGIRKWVRDFFVDTAGGRPVIIEIHDWARMVSAGQKDLWMGMSGPHAHELMNRLGENGKINLVDSNDNIVAFHKSGMNYGTDSFNNSLWFEFEVMDKVNGLAPGSYYLTVSDTTEASWDPYTVRIDGAVALIVTEQPFVVGGLDDRFRDVGLANKNDGQNYVVPFSLANSLALKDKELLVSLVETNGGQNGWSTTAAALFFNYEKYGNLKYTAEFNVLPPYEMDANLRVQYWDEEEGKYIDIQNGENVRLHASGWSMTKGLVGRDSVSVLEPAPYNLDLMGWNLDTARLYRLTLFKWDDYSKQEYQMGQTTTTHAISTNIIPFEYSGQLYSGSYRIKVEEQDANNSNGFYEIRNTKFDVRKPEVESVGISSQTVMETPVTSGSSIIGYNKADLYIKVHVPGVNLTWPGIEIGTTNQAIKVKLAGDYRYYETEDVTLDTSDPSNQTLIAHFPEVDAGKYQVGINISFYEAMWNYKLFLDSVDYCPMIYRSNLYVPVGNNELWLYYEGYGLDALRNQDDKVDAELIDASGNTVASTINDKGEYYWQDYDWQRSSWMKLQFKTVDDKGIKAGTYTLRVNGVNYNGSLSYRLPALVATTDAFVDGDLNTRLIGRGQSHFTLRAPVSNLNNFDYMKYPIVFKLSDYKGYTNFISTVSTQSGIQLFDWGGGNIYADFQNVYAPTYTNSLRLEIGYTDDNGYHTMPGGEYFNIDITDDRFTYDHEFDKYDLSGDYNVSMKGWKLNEGAPYTVYVTTGAGINIVEPFTVTSDTMGTNISFNLALPKPVAEGNYILQIKDNKGNWLIDKWDVKLEDPNQGNFWIKYEDTFIPSMITESSNRLATFSVRLHADRELTEDDLNRLFIGLGNGDQNYDSASNIQTALDANDSSWINVTFSAISAGDYNMKVDSKSGNWDYKVAVHGREALPIVNKIHIWALPQDINGIWLDYEGMDLHKLDGTVSNIRLVDTASSQAIAEFVPSTGDQKNYDIWDEGRRMGIKMKVLPGKRLAAGMNLRLEINSSLKLTNGTTDTSDDTAWRSSDIVRTNKTVQIKSEFFLEGWKEPWILGADPSNYPEGKYKIRFGAFNLDKVAPSDLTIVLKDKDSSWSTTAQAIEFINLDPEIGYRGEISASFNYSDSGLPDKNTSLSVEIRYKNGMLVPGSEGIEIEVAESSNLKIFNRYIDRDGASNFYKVTFEGVNVNTRTGYTLDVKDSSGGTVTPSAISYSVRNDRVEAFVSFDNVLAQGEYEFVLNIPGEDDRTESCWRYLNDMTGKRLELLYNNKDFVETYRGTDGKHYTDLKFPLAVYADNINASTLTVRLDSNENSFGAAIAPIVDINGMLRTEFSHVRSGGYTLSIVENGETVWSDWIYVAPYENMPVIDGETAWAQPDGVSDWWVGFRGNNLFKLNGKILSARLVDDKGTTVTTDDTIVNWAEEYYFYNGEVIKIRFSKSGGVPKGNYKLELTTNLKTSDNREWTDIVRFGSVWFTDTPYVRGDINPWVLGEGTSKYELRVSGFNLDKIGPNSKITVKVQGWKDASTIYYAQVSNLTTTQALRFDPNDPYGKGEIVAVFDQPTNPVPMANEFNEWDRRLRVQVLVDGQPIEGNDGLFGVEVTADAKVIDAEYLPYANGKHKINIYGWNFTKNSSYMGKVLGPDNLVLQLQNIVVKSDTLIEAELVTASPLLGYDLGVVIKNGAAEYIGECGLHEAPVPEVKVGSVEITAGPSNIMVPGTAQYTATVKDTEGNIMVGEQVEWRIQGTPAGVSIAQDGTLTVTGTAIATDIVIEAVSKKNSTKIASTTVNLVKSAVVIGNAVTFKGKKVIVPIDISNISNIASGMLEITYDPNVIVASRIIRGSLLVNNTQTWAPNILEKANGKIVIAFANANELSQSLGNLINVEFDVVGNGNSSSGVNINSNFYFKNGAPATIQGVSVISGRVTVKAYGDINGDGLDTGDATTILKNVVKLNVFDDIQNTAADVDNDKIVTSQDALYVLRKIVGLDPKFPVEP